MQRSLSVKMTMQHHFKSPKQRATAIMEILSKSMPEPKTELNFHNPYTLLVAVTLSAQATDVSVNKATEGLFQDVQSPQQMLDLGIKELIQYIRTIGLYNSKAKNVMAMAEILVEQYNGMVPQTLEELQALPGVGRKTANVVLNVAFGQPTIAVDTHIFRVANRTGIAKGKTPDIVERKLMKVIPPNYQMHAHHWLILHGRYVCKARKPDCVSCTVSDYCTYGLSVLRRAEREATPQ